MSKALALLLSSFSLLHSETHPMTLKQAVDTALKLNPDIALAHLDEEKARLGVRVAKAPFYPTLVAGSGLAYSNGFPMTIDGAAPSIFQATGKQDIFNRQQMYAVTQAREEARGAGFAATSKSDEVAFRTASLYLDAERSARLGDLARKQADSLQKVLETVQTQVREGRALPLAEKSAAATLAHAKQAADLFEDDQATTESALATALGFPAEDRVRPVEGERAAPALPKSEEDAVTAALASNKDLRRLESQIAAKEIEVRGVKAQRWPRVDLVAQYSLLAKFNNYADYFTKFQRNNGQIGISFQIPVLAGPAISAQSAQVQGDIARLKIEVTNTRNRIRADLQQSYRTIHRAETGAEVARLDLDAAREQISVNLALLQEGKITLRQVEESRAAENEKWIAFYDAQYSVERARWAVLRLTGDLTAAVAALPAN